LCPDFSRTWSGSRSDHYALEERFADHNRAIHRRSVGVLRNPETRFPLHHVSPPGTLPFLDPRFFVFDVPWMASPHYVGTGRPHPKLEERGYDIWGAGAITGLSLAEIYNRQGILRVDDGGMHELFLECRRPDGRYSPIRLWDFRIDILESREAQRIRRKQREERASFLARRVAEALPIDPHTYGSGYERGAPEEERYYPLDVVACSLGF
jgi:hypothetical protein